MFSSISKSKVRGTSLSPRQCNPGLKKSPNFTKERQRHEYTMHGLGNLNETKACHGHQFHPVSDNRLREAQNCLPKRNEIEKLTRTWQMSKSCIFFLQICCEEMFSKGILCKFCCCTFLFCSFEVDVLRLPTIYCSQNII